MKKVNILLTSIWVILLSIFYFFGAIFIGIYVAIKEKFGIVK